MCLQSSLDATAMTKVQHGEDCTTTRHVPNGTARAFRGAQEHELEHEKRGLNRPRPLFRTCLWTRLFCLQAFDIAHQIADTLLHHGVVILIE